MLIREENKGDVAAIRVITEAAFENHPHSIQTEGRIISALREAGALALSLVAEDGGKVMGHVAFSQVTIEDVAGDWNALGPISVAPALQRMGIGGALIRHGLERLKQAGAAGCVLVGDPAYYRRFGFVADNDLTWRDLPKGYLQYLSFSGDVPRGEVRFHPAFDVA